MKQLLMVFAVILAFSLVACNTASVTQEILSRDYSERAESSSEESRRIGESAAPAAESSMAETSRPEGASQSGSGWNVTNPVQPLQPNRVKGNSINESYFDLIGANYEQISEEYGEANIYFAYEYGLYASFDEAEVTGFFGISVYENRYDSIDSWIFDENEFSIHPVYVDRYYNFETGSYSKSDFVTAFIYVWGDSLHDFLDVDTAITYDTITEIFGEERELYENEMEGTVCADGYIYKNYSVNFEFYEENGDYVAGVAKILPVVD